MRIKKMNKMNDKTSVFDGKEFSKDELENIYSLV